MDTKTIITIVVTAVVTAMARRLVEAIEGWLKTRNIAGTVMATARKWLTLARIAPLIDLGAVMSLAFAIGRRFPGDVPVMGRDVPDIIALATFTALFAGSLVYRVAVRHRAPGPPDS